MAATALSQLEQIGRVVSAQAWFHDFAADWESKTFRLHVQLTDIPSLVVQYGARSTAPYELNHDITLVDQVPEIRLSNACESIGHLVYSMGEVAAHLANRMSHGVAELPASFNAIRKKCERGQLPENLINELGDLKWYRKVREMRTEWAHYSTPFVSTDKSDVILVVRGRRSKGDKTELTANAVVRVSDLVEWAGACVATLEGLARWLLTEHAPRWIPFGQVLNYVEVDKNGYPLLKNARFQPRQILVDVYLAERGIKLVRPAS